MQARTMRVLFDQQIMAQRYGGVSRYVLSLLRALNARSDVHAQLAALAHFNAYIRPGDALHRLSFRLEWPQRGTRFRARVVEPLFRLACATSRPDVIHETGHMPQAEGRSRRAAVVTTLHDMILERFPAFFEHAEEQIRERRQALQRARAIICISANTRADLLARYPELEPKAHVVWHGVDPTVSTAPRFQSRARPYLLFVGTRGGYKNFDRLLRAFGASSELRGSFELVCFGGGALQANELAAAKRAGLSAEQLVHVNGDDSELARAYRHARAFVFPSTYEGFGMPLTEAMVQGCPIACSRASSFPEVCGDAAIYFDPLEEGELRDAIESIALDEAVHSEMTKRAKARAQLFSWQKCAAETAGVYRQALGRSA